MKTILITGASRGLGKGLSDHYRNRGETVLGTSRSGQDGLFPLDVTDPSAVLAMADRLADVPVDMLVCNAGVYLDKTETLDRGYPPSLWAQTLSANVTGVFLTVQALLPNLRAARDPKIAIMSSSMASNARAPGGSYAYRASKAAVLNLGRNLATDLRPDRIAVGIYDPGWVRTDMGGANADISVEQSVAGLVERLALLSLDNTGCFETWDGQMQLF